MTKLSNQKTFYAKTFEPVLRNYFKCPSQTTINKPAAYFFLQNKDNKSKYYRTVDKGLSDVFLKSYNKDSMAEEKYLSFFPYINKTNGAFTVGEEHWKTFIEAINYSGEKTVWGVFCIDEDHFILAHNKSSFDRHKVTITTNSYIFDAFEIFPKDCVLFTRSVEDNKDWIVESNGNVITMKYDKQYKGILPENAQCFPLPRIGKKHLFFINKTRVEATFTDIANQYHGAYTVDNFITKLRRNLKSNENQVAKDLRMKPVKNTKIAVIPDDFTEQDVIDWQTSHLNQNKTDSKDYERIRKQQYRMSRKSDNT